MQAYSVCKEKYISERNVAVWKVPIIDLNLSKETPTSNYIIMSTLL